MQANKFYLLKVWVISAFFIALVCACWPYLLTYPMKTGPESLEFREGIFLGILEYDLYFSVVIFICLYGLFYFLSVRFFLSPLLAKSVLFFFLLIGVFIANYFDYTETWFHPFYMSYAAIAALAFWQFNMYRLDLE